VANYRVRIKKSAAKELERAEPIAVRQAIAGKIRRLADDPRPPGCEKLAGYSDRFRVRHGAYRIVYSVADDVLTVFVVRIGHRSDVYRRR
jgi:mRNA interferase RelE/StbE